MRARLAPVPFFAAIIALAVITSGCIAQDRPHEPTYTIVADAGAEVVADGQSAHLHWAADHALEAEGGEHVEEHPHLEWEASNGAHGTGENFTVVPAGRGLVLVELNVSDGNHSATDVGGVLALPPGPGARHAFIGVVGDIELELEGDTFADQAAVTLGHHHGHYYSAAAPGAHLRLKVLAVTADTQAAFLISIKSGGGQGQVNITKPLVFSPGLNYTLVLDTASPYAHHIEVADPATGGAPEESSLAEFTEAHEGAAEGRFLVTPAGQTLPGFEALAAAVALTLAILVATRRR